LKGFGVEVGTELLALAVEDYLVQVFYLAGLFHVQVVLLWLVECALLALLVGDALPAFESFVLPRQLLQLQVYACVLSAA
jgi:hypothetical protein